MKRECVSELIVGSQRYPQHLGATTILQTTVATQHFALTNRAGHPFSSIVAETLQYVVEAIFPPLERNVALCT